MGLFGGSKKKKGAGAKSEFENEAQALATMSALLKGGARVTAKDAYGLTALHLIAAP